MLFSEFYEEVRKASGYIVSWMLSGSQSFADGSSDPDDLVVITDPDSVVYVGVLADGDGKGSAH